MKSVLISIRPKWCELIASGKKTLEIRKTRPKLETPFKCYIYCTKPSKKYQTICGCMVLNSDELYRHPRDGIKYGDSIELMALNGKYSRDNFLNGKVIGEFICDKIEEFTADYRTDTEKIESIADLACVEMSEVMEYGYFSDLLLAWHISDRKVCDKPKALSEFSKPQTTRFITQSKKIKRAPQSWCYVESLKEVEE